MWPRLALAVGPAAMLVLPTLTAVAEMLGFASAVGWPGADEANAVAVDTGGNAYLTGDFQGTASFGGASLTSAGGSDAYVVKVDTPGAIQWARCSGGTGDDAGVATAVDSGTNAVEVAGSNESTVVFGPGTGPATLTSTGFADGRHAKLDGANGSVLWAVGLGGRIATEGTFRSLSWVTSGRLVSMAGCTRRRVAGPREPPLRAQTRQTTVGYCRP